MHIISSSPHPQTHLRTQPRQIEARPTPTAVSSEPTESFSSQATVENKKSKPGFFKRAGKKALNLADSLAAMKQAATRIAFAAVPGLAGVALQSLSNLADKIPGERFDGVSARLESAAARTKRAGLGQATELVSGIVEKKFGPNVSDLQRFERTLAKQLQPENGELPAYLEELRTGEPRENAPTTLSPFSPFPAYVHLEGNPEKSREIVQRFHQSKAPLEENPYQGTEFEAAWNTLAAGRENGRLPIFVDLDGKPGEISPTEKIAAGMVASLQDRGANGDELSGVGELLATTDLRLEASRKFDTWVKKSQPQIGRTLDNVKKLIKPMEPGLLEKAVGVVERVTGARASNGLQWRSDPGKLDTAYRSLLLPLAEAAQSGKIEDQTRWVDTVAGLDQSLHTGLQTNWMRLNKELSPEQRQSLFRPLVSSWLDLSLSPDPHSPDVVPDSGLKVPHVEKTGNKDAIHFHDYNRALAAGAAVDHLLDGAGIEERKEMLAFIKQEMRKRDGQAQEFVDRNTQLAGRLKPPTLNELLDEKKRPLAEVGSPGYNALQTWISRNSERYFDPAETLGPELTGVSEFYNPNKKTPKSVTRVMDLLQSQPTGDQPLTETFGQGEKTSKASMVFAGGGGKGLVYTHQLKHLSAQLSASKDGKFEIDEFVGTSAGAITAGLLAAGFSPKELDVVMKEIDFSSFYSDYFGKQGGIDPTARGLNRSGIFSMRSMYETLSGLLSSKLGVEGRPVTFADLKPDLKIVTRLTTTDLPEGSELTEQTGPDGKFVFSKENTPHMDVAAALIASSAIPAFFDPPQMMVSGADGEPRRMQFTDGGILDNFAVSETSKAEKSVLAIIPNPSAGVLTTDFMPPAEELEKAFAMGDQLMQGKIASSLVPSYHRLRDNLDMGRIVFGNYLVGNLDEAADITFQGQSRSDTRAIYEHIAAPSHVAGAGLFPTETLVEDMMNKILTGKPDLVAGIAGRMGGRGVKESEVDGPEEVILSTLRGALSSPKEAFQTA